MKTICLFLLLMQLFAFSAPAQIYVDPVTSGAVAAGSSMMDSQLKKSNNELTLIQRAQLSVTAQLGIANDLQRNIYRGLSEVSAVMRSLLSVKDIYEISQDIIQDANKAIVIAKNNPQLLLFAQSGAQEFKTRATRLATEVSDFVLRGGKESLMDSGERIKLLNRIVLELSIIRGVSYGIYRSMYWAKQRGFFASINPYSGFINIDKRIADDILFKVKMLKR
ncbi:hypothetical protein [Pedobacter ghigonis]|uniref:hypothetical protein n=1 Tax=Pedobacter ghigonis TaxID=2730403 RepID=UPI001588634F|nr:hypothetical protein [Pedobacter ghigonis]